MRRLTLLRHAHAIDAVPGQSDIERSLSAAGGAAAVEVARTIAAAVPAPDLLLSSPALRTSQTAASVRRHGFPGVRHETSEELYLATTDDLLALVAGLGDQDHHVMLVGHNPAISGLCVRLTSDRAFRGFQPAGWASLQLPVDSWSEIGTRPVKAELA